MGEILVDEFLSLDGVMQARADPDENGDGGFPYDGWHRPDFDDVYADVLSESLSSSDAL
ncbi:hypothetical protein [Haladaptatus sp. CMAA 1911]|uniref:hypothetical protein n=1 Tax=unclassified Haladaptatus TaxID=2622732 RepID=UPI0037543C58